MTVKDFKKWQEDMERQLEKPLIFGKKASLNEDIISSKIKYYTFDGEGLGDFHMMHFVDCNKFAIGQEFSDGVEMTAYLPEYITKIEHAFDFVQRLDWAAVSGSQETWQLTDLDITETD